jgi:hypothetical protein
MQPYAASRLLTHICEKEEGLREALNARSACAAAISWQKVQQTKMLRHRERARKEVKLVYGLNEQIVNTEPYPSQASAPRMARDGAFGGFRYLHLIPDEPREPDEWWMGGFICALFEPPPPTPTIRAPAPYRVRRPLARGVRLKSGRRETWAIARAAESRRGGYPTYRSETTDWHDGDRDFLDRVLARFTVALKRELLGLLTPIQPRRFIAGIIRESDPEPNDGPMCTPVHSGMVLVAVRRGILPDIELRWSLYSRGRPARRAIWIKLAPFRKPHGLLPAFTRRDWIRWPVKETETLLAKRTEGGMSFYLVRKLWRGAPPPSPNLVPDLVEDQDDIFAPSA